MNENNRNRKRTKDRKLDRKSDREYGRNSDRYSAGDRTGSGSPASRRTARSEREPADETERRRRQRAARRAKRERELRRQKRILGIVIGAAGVALAAVLFLVVRNVLGSRKTAESSLAEESTLSTSEENGQAASTEGTESGESETADASTAQNAPYVFTETSNTVQLGESLTDISIYDAQRHITSSTSASDTASSEEAEDEDSTGEDAGEDSSLAASLSAEEAAKASDYVDSQYAMLVNIDTGEILAERRGFEQMVPASMTKVMTLLVAVEAMEDQEQQLQDKVTITQEICDESYSSGSSFVGYGVGDEATVEDLLYGAILPSGADAAMALAEYTSGSQDAFVEKMNEKAQELGISETTHFTNCVGLYNEDHYSTAYDMCVIMRAAIDNELCKKVLSTHTWTTGALKDNPNGVEISNWFLRRIEDHDSGGTVVCGKTGFVNESGNCAVSYEEGADGTGYIACTALTYNLWRCIYDHVALYKTYAK